MFVLGGCGSDGDDDETTTPTPVAPESDYAIQLAENIGVHQESLGLSSEQAICLANGIIDTLGGADRFQDAGIEADQLVVGTKLADLGVHITEEEVHAIGRVFAGCRVEVVSVLIDGFATQASIPAEVEACIHDSVDVEALRVDAARRLLGLPAAPSPQLVASIAPCLEPLTDDDGAPSTETTTSTSIAGG